MANGVKTYEIRINGLDRAQSQVDALVRSLESLESRLNALSSSSGRTSSRGSGSSSKQLTKEEANLRSIQKTQEQIAAAREDSYSTLIKERDALKEVREEQEAQLAAQRLSADEYGNTMRGLRRQLSDIKKVMASTDLGSSQFQDLIRQADQVNTKLSELEQQYGQFGRNVGNYKSAVEDFQQVEVVVGGVTRTFSNARQASRQLTNELRSMAAQGLRDTRQYKDLERAVRQFNASLEDVQSTSQMIDDLTDAVTSFTAIGSIGEGISAIFGFDDAQLQQSIQRLLAFQNILQGIEQLRMQMQRGEFFGNFFNGIMEWAGKTYDRLRGVKEELQDIRTEATKPTQVQTSTSTTTQGRTATTQSSVVEELRIAQQSANQMGETIAAATANMSNLAEETDNVGNAMDRVNETTSNAVSNTAAMTEVTKTLNELLDDENKKFAQNLDDWEKAQKNLETSVEAARSEIKNMNAELAAKYPKFDESGVQEFSGQMMTYQEAIDAANKRFDELVANVDGANQVYTETSQALQSTAANIDTLEKRSKTATSAVGKLSAAIKGLGISMRAVFQGLILGAIITAIMALIDGIVRLVQYTAELAKGDADLVDKNKLVEQSLSSLNDEIERSNDLLAADYLSGRISLEEYYARSIQNTTKALREYIAAVREAGDKSLEKNFRGLSGPNGLAGRKITSTLGGEMKFNNLDELTETWKEFVESVKEGEDYFSRRSHGISDWFRGLIYTVDDTKDEITNFGQVALGEFMNRYEHAMDTLATDTEAGRKEISSLIELMNSNELVKSVLANPEMYIKSEEVVKRVKTMMEWIERFNGMVGSGQRTAEEIERSERLRIEAMEDGFAQRQALRDLEQKKELSQLNLTEEDRRNIIKKYDNERIEDLKTTNEKLQSEARSHSDAMNRINDSIQSMRIELMRDDFQRQLAELRLEWNQRLREAKASEAKQREQIELINQVYNRREIAMMSEHYRELQRMREQAEKSRRAVQQETMDRYFETTQTNADLSLSSRRFDTPMQPMDPSLSAMVQSRQEFYDRMLSAQEEYGRKTLEMQKEQYSSELEQQKLAEDQRYNEAVGRYQGTPIEQSLGAYNKAMDNQSIPSGVSAEAYFSAYDKALKEWLISLEKGLQEGSITVERYNEIVANENAQAYLDGRQSFTEYMSALQAEKQTHDNAMLSMERSYEASVSAAVNSFLTTMEQNTAQSMQRTAQDISTALGQIRQSISGATVTGALEFVNIPKTEDNLNRLKESVRQAMTEIDTLMSQASTAFANREIDFSQYEQITKDLTAVKDSATQTLNEIEDEAKRKRQELLQQLGQLANVAGQALLTVMQQYGQYQDQEYQSRIDALSDYLEELQEKYDEQAQITQNAANEINSIEGELENARGSRRQNLIDQLNAEIEKQRQSAAEEKKLQKEQENVQKQQEKLEEQRRKAQKKRDIAQATVSTSLAILNALSTRPWWLAITQAAIAAAMGAAQIAIISKTKYAKGGLLQGPSHTQGGIPVGATGIEVEGNEYVVNKKTAMTNLPLMEYVNGIRRRITLEDLVSFYASDKPYKGIRKQMYGKYAEGGELPTLRSLEWTRSFESALESYENRPVVVSVVDIMNKSEGVRKVQTLAGLERN